MNALAVFWERTTSVPHMAEDTHRAICPEPPRTGRRRQSCPYSLYPQSSTGDGGNLSEMILRPPNVQRLRVDFKQEAFAEVRSRFRSLSSHLPRALCRPPALMLSACIRLPFRSVTTLPALALTHRRRHSLLTLVPTLAPGVLLHSTEMVRTRFSPRRRLAYPSAATIINSARRVTPPSPLRPAIQALHNRPVGAIHRHRVPPNAPRVARLTAGRLRFDQWIPARPSSPLPARLRLCPLHQTRHP